MPRRRKRGTGLQNMDALLSRVVDAAVKGEEAKVEPRKPKAAKNRKRKKRGKK